MLLFGVDDIVELDAKKSAVAASHAGMFVHRVVVVVQYHIAADVVGC
jgi:hypothetical protein